ncbi:RNA polymerase sigma factor [Dactylosporangium sp. CA-092794]|uniref:RNA polymerase sigma factor n=1 Tax=Dactylosporangium sp. CA-092794 TaxID=3239929 RepID=UPI003D8EF0D2
MDANSQPPGPQQQDVNAARAATLLRLRGPLSRYVAGLLAPNGNHVEDIVQETLLRAWVRAAHVDWRESQLRPWLFRIAHNLVIDAWRKERSVPVGVGGDAFDEPAVGEDVADVVADRHLLVRALRRIPPAQQEILVHVHLLDRAGEEVARRLGIPVGTVKSRTYTAIRSLRQELAEGEAAA